ncbi:putative Ferriportin iron efflux transporter [Polychaeton citri CBS 116435]|uniref:Solute carrier family 40 member n=1 Tax=Polychaeton citri CBS 116435 TaxID=1314669 RepID=A0A9P4QDC8_9PEZI|nr:putative Ferriportin iron efflux transporter [Polychaeton citri CBS 116435]
MAARRRQDEEVSSSNSAEQQNSRFTLDTLDPAQGHSRTEQLLYISHFLSTWNARVFEFGAFLFLARLYPKTLLPVSVYALSASAAGASLSSWVGERIDKGNRMSVARQSIIGQRLSVVASCSLLAIMASIAHLHQNQTISAVFLAIVSGFGVTEKLSAMMNMISIERDWVVTIAEGSEERLRRLNSQMRRIDLLCKLVGPLAISLVDGYSTRAAITTTLAMACLSLPVEYFAIARVYLTNPELQKPKMTRIPVIIPSTLSQTARLLASVKRATQDTWAYVQHPVFLPSFSLSLLYLTVLSISGPMTTYLLSLGIPSTMVGLIRAVSATFELSATWLAPFVINRIAAVRAGIWFINWQLFCVALSCMFFWLDLTPAVAATGTISAVIASRVGLWSFDLSAQLIVQEEVESDMRGAFSSQEFAFQNIFEMMAFTSTAIFSKPEQFKYPATISTCAVALSSALYAAFVRARRGHLVHLSRCIERPRKSSRPVGDEQLTVYDEEAIPLAENLDSYE